jgi:hypothetical protein
MTFLSAIGTGFGIMIGMMLFILTIIILVKVLGKKKAKFTKELFLEYRDKILSEENYEEVKVVNNIIEKLERGENPKELIMYDIESDNEVVMRTGKNEEASFKFKKNEKIIKKKIKVNSDKK